MVEAHSNTDSTSPQWDRLCEWCKGTPTYAFEWRYDSQRSGQEVRISYFCSTCETLIRDRCISPMAEAFAWFDSGYRVSIEGTAEGIETYIYDGTRKAPRLTRTLEGNRTQRRQKRQEIPVVYLIQEMGGTAIKIGHAFDAEQRRKQLQIGNSQRLIILRTIPLKAAAELEQALHRRYRAYRQDGEWFALPPETLAALLEEDFA